MSLTLFLCKNDGLGSWALATLCSDGDFLSAKSCLCEAIKWYPLGDVYLNLADCDLRLQEFDAAIEDCQHAMTFPQNKEAALTKLAHAHAEHGTILFNECNFTAAALEFRRAQDSNPHLWNYPFCIAKSMIALEVLALSALSLPPHSIPCVRA